MRKITFLLLVALLIVSCVNESVTQTEQACDNGTFVGDVLLSTQQEVDEFGAMCYTKIEGILRIGNYPSVGADDITNLSNLSSIKEVQEVLFIHAKNLISLQGLEGLNKVGQLQIFECNKLTSLEGLNNLEIVNYEPSPENSGYLLISDNDLLESFNGLYNLRHISNGLGFSCNPKLQQIDALENLNYLGGSLGTAGSCPSTPDSFGVGNAMLSDFCGLRNLFLQGTYDMDEVNIQNNAFNPTVQDIIDGNCSQ